MIKVQVFQEGHKICNNCFNFFWAFSECSNFNKQTSNLTNKQASKLTNKQTKNIPSFMIIAHHELNNKSQILTEMFCQLRIRSSLSELMPQLSMLGDHSYIA